jgi:hypothetical protein
VPLPVTWPCPLFRGDGAHDWPFAWPPRHVLPSAAVHAKHGRGHGGWPWQAAGCPEGDGGPTSRRGLTGIPATYTGVHYPSTTQPPTTTRLAPCGCNSSEQLCDTAYTACNIFDKNVQPSNTLRYIVLFKYYDNPVDILSSFHII